MIAGIVAIVLPLMAFAQDSLNILEIDSLRARTPAYPILVKEETVIQRSFLEYENKVLDYVVSVGDPEGIHYAVNTFNGSLIKAWRGAFLDGSLMWVWKARGIALAVPTGTVVKLGNEKAFCIGENALSSWGDSLLSTDHYVFRGYQVDKKNRPVFLYEIGGIQVRDRIVPTASQGLTRSLILKGPIPKDFYHRIISGINIIKISKNVYEADKTFKIIVPANSKMSISQQGNKQVLLIQLTGDLQYDLSW